MAEPVASRGCRRTRATHLGIVVGLAMGPAVGLGLGRFAYALLLPAMRADLGWSYAQAGAINTANAAGYLVGALLAAPMAARFGDKRGVLAGLLLTTAFAAGERGQRRTTRCWRRCAPWPGRRGRCR